MSSINKFDVIEKSGVDPAKIHVAKLALELVCRDLNWRLPVMIEWLRPNENGQFHTTNRLSWCTANAIGLSSDCTLNQICEEVARQMKTIALCVGGGQPNTPALSAEAENFALRYSGMGARLSMPMSVKPGRGN